MKSPAKSPGKPADDDRLTASADLDGSHDMVEELASAAMQAAGLRKFSPQFNAFVLYLFFLAIFNTVVFGPRNSDPFYMRQSLDDMFLGNEYDYGIDYHGTASIAQVWQWIDSIMLPNLYPDSWYNGNPRYGDDLNTVTDVAGYRIGLARLRNVRVQPDSCEVSRFLSNSVDNCYAPYSCSMFGSTEGTEDWFNPLETTGNGTKPWDTLPDTIFYQTPEETRESDFYSTRTTNWYCAGGQVIDLPDSYANASAITNALWNSTWIDRSTRALFFEFNLYNANTDVFAVFRAAVEFLPTGTIVPSESITVLPLVKPLRAIRTLMGADEGADSTSIALLCVEFFLYLFVLYYILREFRVYSKDRAVYLRSGWNWLEIFNLSTFLCVMLLRCYTMYAVSQVTDTFTITHRYIGELTTLVENAKMVDNLNAINAVISFVKIFKFVRYNKKLSQFIDTVSLAVAHMGSLMVILSVVMVAYGVAFHLGWGTELAGYRNFATSFYTLFKATLGDFDLDELLSGTNWLFGPILFISFIVVMFFVIVSMFLAIVDNAYEAVRQKLDSVEDDHPFNSDVVYVLTLPRRILDYVVFRITNCCYAWEKLPSPLQQEEEEELGIEKKEADDVAPLDADNPASAEAAAPPEDPYAAQAALYRQALVILEDLRDNQEKLETMVTQVEADA